MYTTITKLSFGLLLVLGLCVSAQAQQGRTATGTTRQPAAGGAPVRQPATGAVKPATSATADAGPTTAIPGNSEAISGTTSDQNSLDSIPEVREGLELLKTGDREGAAVKFSEAYKKRPDLTPAGVAVAISLFNNKQFGDVRYWLEKTVETCPSDPETYIILAEVAQAEGHFTEAKLLTEAGTRLASDYKDNAERRKKIGLRARLVLAMIAEKKGKLDEAKSHLETIIKAAPDEPDYLSRLALIQFQQDDLKNALATFGQAIDKGAQLPPPYSLLAQLLEQKGNTAEAKRYIEAAIKGNPNDYQVAAIAAHLYTKWNMLPQAKSYADKALSAKPDAPEAKQMCALIALYEQKYADAQKMYEEIIAQVPNDFAAKNGLALSLSEQGEQKAGQAVEVAKQNAEANPNSIDAVSTLAWALFKAGQAEQAKQLLLQIRNTGVMSATGAYYLAEIFDALGDKKSAKELADVSLSTNNNYPKKAAALALQKSL